MEQADKIAAVMNKSKQNFLERFSTRLKDAFLILLDYNLRNSDQKLKKELINFFHSLKGISATLGFEELATIASKYEDYLATTADNKEEIILQVIDGLSLLQEEYKSIKEEERENTEDKEGTIAISEKLNEDKTLFNTQYTNLTTSGTILIIDDDVELLELLERVLREYGYQILITSDSQEGIKILEEEEIDLILLDLVLPQTDGFSVLKSIRKLDFQQPTIFLSAKDEVETKVKGLELGADDYITKPFDVKELKARIERILKKESNFKNKIIKDELTGAYTKSYFHERAKEEKERFNRGNERFAIAFLDLDNFKEINDSNGHLVGDQVLQGFTDFLKKNLRTIDQVYRFGGDEFLVLFPQTTADDAYQVVNRLKDELQVEQLKGLDLENKVTFSSGISQLESLDESIEELLERADQSLYKVKQNGKNGVAINSNLGITRENKKILIVDDEDIIVDLVRTRLSSLGYSIEYSSNGQSGIELVEEYQPDLMIIDLMMPKINGFEVIRQLKNNRANQQLKIIVLSSKTSDKDINRSFELGADDYLAKPFSLAELENRVKRII
ncbi:MAG: response regulator [Bacillota bacterium]